MRIGIFHPNLNLCGGGEWVALQVVNSLKNQGHQVVVLSDQKIDQNKFLKIFGQKIPVDLEITFPGNFFFKKGDPHNVYLYSLGCLLLKSKTDLVIDTFSCLTLPGVDIVYMHFPLFNQSRSAHSTFEKLKVSLYFSIYQVYAKKLQNKETKLVFANSKYTSEAITKYLGLSSKILYPPLSTSFFATDKEYCQSKRLNQVITVSRFAYEKNLEIIPEIASRLPDVKFLVIGNLHRPEVFAELKRVVKKKGLEQRVLLLTNVQRDQLRKFLLESKIYLHCAKDEHFGISILEAMACGCVPVVHNSGGPKEFSPKSTMYNSIDEATQKINETILTWSPKISYEMYSEASFFSIERFSSQLMKVIEATYQ